MTARDLIIDFINFLFFIALTAFFVFYFVLGRRTDQLIEILKSLAPFSIFGLAFLFKLKGFAKTMKRAKEVESFSDEEQWVISNRDIVKDRMITIFLPIIVLASAFIDGEVNNYDIYQSLFCFFYILFFHWIMFRKQASSELHALNKNDKTRDEIVIFFLPVVMLAIPMTNNTFDTVDILQTVSVFTILFIWHHIVFKKE